jgi:hypothetical protein
MRDILSALTPAILLSLLSLLSLSSLPPAQADEHRLSGGDTARQSAAQSRGLPAQPKVTNRIGASSGSTPVPADPAERQYWSDRCVQQRARGWGHTGDCESPAYHGGGVRKRPRWYRGDW